MGATELNYKGDPMRRRLPILTLSILVGAGISSPTQAVEDGVLDSDNTYPRAGAGVLVAATGEPTEVSTFLLPAAFTHCSGSLIGQSLFLTAQHCAFLGGMLSPYYDMYVTLDPEPMDGFGVLGENTKLMEVVEVIDAPLGMDLRVLRLKEPAEHHYPGIEPVGLASDGLLDELTAGGGEWVMTYAGYGTTGDSVRWKRHLAPFPYPLADVWYDNWYASRYLGDKPFLGVPWWGKQLALLHGPGALIAGGDSGAPIFWEDSLSGRRKQVAVVKGAWWEPDQDGVWYQMVSGFRVDHPLAQLFFDCVMLEDDADRDVCLENLRLLPPAPSVPGDFNHEVFCEYDWMPDCDVVSMEEGEDGLYRLSVILPGGYYEYKVALHGLWLENYGEDGVRDGPNIGLWVPFPEARVIFTYNNVTHFITHEVLE